jgi:hypothetical protein
MRVLSSSKVVESADRIVRTIETDLAPNKTFPELRDMLNSGSIDLLRDFGEACRAEFVNASGGGALTVSDAPPHSIMPAKRLAGSVRDGWGWIPPFGTRLGHCKGRGIG